MIEEFFLTQRLEPQQVLLIWVSVDLGVMLMKGYSAFPNTPGLEPLS